MQKTSIESLILHAWPLPALLQGEEPTTSKVLKTIDDAERKTVSLHMSWINVGEVYHQVGERRADAAAAVTLREILLLPVRFHEVGRQDVLRAAETKMKFALSYADGFAVALAQSLDGTIPTGDPEIVNLDLGIKAEKLERL